MSPVVLIVEDDSDLGPLLLRIVRKRGIAARLIDSATAIEGALLVHDPSLVLLDNHLRDGLGVKFVPYIREVCPRCCIVLMTADDRELIRQSVDMRLLNGFLSKPFATAQLEPFLEQVQRIHN